VFGLGYVNLLHNAVTLAAVPGGVAVPREQPPPTPAPPAEAQSETAGADQPVDETIAAADARRRRSRTPSFRTSSTPRSSSKSPRLTSILSFSMG
jgi:hypothetical protein